MEKIHKTDAEWRQQLTPEQYLITRGHGTERAFCGVFYDNHKTGTYHCVCCDLPLFSSQAKFDSGTGWPSFFESVNKENVLFIPDHSHGMSRVEITCARCDAHLGHVFQDGPPPTGLRYCLNSGALTFHKAITASEHVSPSPSSLSEATFAAGCFWGVEERFRQTFGVKKTAVGYTGGHTDSPTYKEVCNDTTGHAEAVHIEFDPGQVSYTELLKIFFANHNPTTRNRQGPDYGSQYRSAIFYHTPEQKHDAEEILAYLEKEKVFSRPIVTELVPATKFHRAEEYHQQYLAKRGAASCSL